MVMKYKKGKKLTAKQIKKYEWSDVLWVDVLVDKGAGFKVRISEPVVVTRHDEGENYICMSVHDNGCDDICIDFDKYKKNDTLFYEEEPCQPESRYKFYKAIK